MDQWVRDGFVLGNDLALVPAGDLIMTGTISCLGGIEISVHKILEMTGQEPDILVQTVEYSYNVRIRGVGSIFRYDAPHVHRPFHHKHVYGFFDGDRRGEAVPLDPPNDWPVLGEVIQEAFEWYCDNLDRLTRS